MSQSLTDWLQHSRFVVVGVDPARGHLRIKGEAEVCTDLSCSERTLVVTDDGTGPGLAALNPGDIVRIDRIDGKLPRIIVVRTAADEIGSPEL